MASLRKKYQGLVVDSSDEPVTTAPVTEAAKLPEPIADVPALPEEVNENPVADAAQNAIKQRLLEAERAQELTKEKATQPQAPQHERPADPAAQFEAALAHLPERVRGWYRVDPQHLDERAAQIQYAHHVVRRELGEGFTEPYYAKMEHALGVRNVALPESPPQPERRREPAPARQQSGPPVSAPPTRDSYSMASGRPMSGPTQLTGEERELAKTLGLTDQQYLDGKKRMLRERGEGHHQ